MNKLPIPIIVPNYNVENIHAFAGGFKLSRSMIEMEEPMRTNKIESEWQILAQHEQWVVEYKNDSQIIRMSLDDKVIHLEREAYQLLWGVITQGLDELERVEDESARIRGLSHAAAPQAIWSQTRH